MSLDAAATLKLGIETKDAEAAIIRLQGQLNKLGVGSFTQSSNATSELEARLRTLQAEMDRVTASTKRGETATRSAANAQSYLMSVQLRSAEMTGKLSIKSAEDRIKAETSYQTWKRAALAREESEELASYSRRVSQASTAIKAKQSSDNSYTAWWSSELARRDAAHKSSIMDSVSNLKRMEAEERASSSRRRADAISAINSIKAAQSQYTAWWIAELKKREAAHQASVISSVQAIRAAETRANKESQARLVAATQMRAAEQARYRARQADLDAAFGAASVNSMNNQSEVTRRLAADKSKLTAEQLRARAATSALTESQNMLHSAFRGVGGAVGGLWMTYAKYVSVMVAAAAVTKTFYDSISRGLNADFQSQFVSLFQTKGELDLGLKDKILKDLIDVSRDSVFTVTENAEAMKKLALAGVDATSSVELLTVATNAAIFSQTTLEEATIRILDAVNNFGMVSENPLIMAESFKQVANVMTIAASTVNASFTDIARSFENLTGVAESFNIKVEEAAVLLQSLARAGVRGPRAGTYLRNFFDDFLGAPISQKAEKKLIELGVERYDPEAYGTGEFGVAMYVDKLRKSLEGLTFVEQQNAIRAISNQRSRRVLRQEMVATNTTLERTLELQKQALTGDGALTKMAEGLQDNAKMKFNYAQAAYDSAVASGFAGYQALFAKVGEDLQSLFNSDSFAEFTSWGVRSIGEIAGSLTEMLKWVVENRKGLEMFGNTIMWLAGGAVIGALMVGLSSLMAHPVLLIASGVLVAASAAHRAMQQDYGDLEKEAERLRKALEQPDIDMMQRTSWETALNETLAKLEIARVKVASQFDSIAHNFSRVLDENNKALVTFTASIPNMVRSSAGTDANPKDVEAEILYQYQENAEKALGAMDALQEAINHLGDSEENAQAVRLYQKEFARFGEVLDTSRDNIDRYTRSWEKLATGEGLPSGMLNLQTTYLEQRNLSLKEDIELLELGEKGVYLRTVRELELQLASKETNRVLLQRQMIEASSLGDGNKLAALILEANAADRNIASLTEYIQLFQRHFTLSEKKTDKNKDLTSSYDSLVESIKQYHDAQFVEAGFIEELTGYQELYNRAIKEFGDNLEKLTPKQKATVKEWLAQAKAAETVNKAIQDSIKAAEKWEKFHSDVIKPMRDGNAALTERVKVLKEEIYGIQEGSEALAAQKSIRESDEISRIRTVAAIYEEAGAQAALNAQWENRIEFLTLARQFNEQADLTEEVKNLEQFSKGAQNELTLVVDNLKVVDQSFKQFYDDVIERNGNAWSNLRENAKKMFFDWLYQMTIQRWIINVGADFTGKSPQAISQGMGGNAGGFGGGGGGFGGGFGGGSGGSNMNPFYMADYAYAASGLQYGTGFMTQQSTMLAQQNAGLTQGTGVGGQMLGYGAAIFAAVEGNYGQAIGAAIGTYIMPGIGTMIGSFLGSLVDGMFGGGERFPRVVASSTGTFADGKYNSLGEDDNFFSGDEKFGASANKSLDQLNEAFTNRLGALLDTFGIDSTIDVTSRARLRRTSGKIAGSLFGAFGEGDEFEFKKQYGGDAEGIDEAFSQFIQDALTQGIAKAIQGSPLPEHIRDIFSEELSNEQIDAGLNTLINAGEMKSKLEVMPEIFTRLASSIDLVLNATNYEELSEYGEQLAILDQAMKSYYEAFIPMSERFTDSQRLVKFAFDELNLAVPSSIAEFRSLADGLDMTTDEGRDLFITLMNLYPAFYELAGAIEATQASIRETTASNIRDIEMSILNKEQKYSYIDNEIADLLARMEVAQDPATLNDLYDQISKLTMDAYNLLDEDQKKEEAQEFIDLMKAYEDEANARLALMAEFDPQESADAMGDAMTEAINTMVSRMSEVSSEQKESASALGDAVKLFASAAKQLADSVTAGDKENSQLVEALNKVAQIPDRLVLEVPGGFSEVGMR